MSGLAFVAVGSFADDLLLVQVFVFALQAFSAPVPMSFPHAWISSEVTHPKASPSFPSLPSEGWDEGGGGVSQDALVLLPEGLPLLPLDFFQREGWKCLWSLVCCTPLSLRLLRELLRGRLLVRSGHPLPTSLPRWPLPAHHSTLCDVVSQESLLWSTPVRNPPVFLDLRIEEQGRIAEPVLGRTALAIAPVVLALLTARFQAVESIGGVGHLDRCPPTNCSDVISLGLRTTPKLVAFALGLREIDCGPRIATGLVATTLDVTGRVLRPATDHVDSIRDPCLSGRSLWPFAVTQSPSPLS